MRVAVMFDDVDARASSTADERGVLEAVEAVAHAIARHGHRVVHVPVGEPHGGWTRALLSSGADLVFNLCEGAGGSSANEARVAAAVELLGFPMTGSSSETLAFARRKDRVNALLAARDLPVPDWTLIDGAFVPAKWCDYPAIVKPAAEDASVGITGASVVGDPVELEAAIARAAAFAPLLVQRFVPGREVNVGILGEEVLPLAEIDFGTAPASPCQLVSYRAKWDSGSDEDLATTPRCPAALDESLAERVRCVAIAAWRAVAGRGYGRVDLRADSAGVFHVLEVNPNPDLAPSAGFARMGAAAGYDYDELVVRIAREALK